MYESVVLFTKFPVKVVHASESLRFELKVLCSQAVARFTTPSPHKKIAASTKRTANEERASSPEKLSAEQTKDKRSSPPSTKKTMNEEHALPEKLSAGKTKNKKKKKDVTADSSPVTPSSNSKCRRDSDYLKSKSFKHELMRPLKAFVYGSGYGHRITDGGLSLARELRWKSFIDTVKAYDLGGFRGSIDALTARDEELKLHLAHSVYDMFNTTLKVISWQQHADSVWRLPT